MTEQTIQNYDEDEISFLDILVTLAESWKLLVFGPFIAGVVAGGLSFLWPKTFESVAIMRLTEEEVALLYAAPVLDPLIEKFGLLAEAGGIVDDARQELKKHLTFSVDKKTKLATVTAKGRTPAQAKQLGTSAIAVMLKELQVKGQDKAFLEKTIAINDSVIFSAEDAIESILRTLKKGILLDQAQESAIKNLVAINSEIAKRRLENEELRRKLEPKGLEVFVQEPNLPQSAISPNIGLIVKLSILFMECVLLVFVFACATLKQIKMDSATSRKILLIKRNLGWVG